jgi:hypothetical protein
MNDVRDGYTDNALDVQWQPDPLRELMRTDGPLKFRIVRGTRQDHAFGVIGAVWLSADTERSGFIANPAAGNAMTPWVMMWRGALEGGWKPRDIYEYASDSLDRSVVASAEFETEASGMAEVFTLVSA